jgi:hypothetical protein
MDYDFNNPNYEFFRPLVNGWVAKLEASRASRKKWEEVADECMMLYSRSAAAMWDPTYQKKFWQNVKAPKFRITINKAFELVAVFGPNLLWDCPHRTVSPYKRFELPIDLLSEEVGDDQIVQMLVQQDEKFFARRQVVSQLMEGWLNYTPSEMPGGGLIGQSELAVVDALIKGRGCLWMKPYQYPGSERWLTAAFRHPPEDLFIDPDFKTLDDAKWIALRHVEAHWEVERRFDLPAGSLKDKATLESTAAMGESRGSLDRGISDRLSGKSNNLVVWYEIFSKSGVGSRMTDMPSSLKDELESSVGDFAYLAICASCPYPLNAPPKKLRDGATPEEVKEMFSWPVPLWQDGRWPVQVLDFYPDPESPWPIPPIAPGLGELKLLNFLIPWLANRVWSSSRDFWAVLSSQVDHYTKYLENGSDQCIIPVPPGMHDDIRKVVQVLQQPETRMDVWKIIELVSTMFDKRTGLTEFAYGRNEDGTQNRTAEETLAKKAATGVRPEHMQKKVTEWQARVATVEGLLAHRFVTAEDVAPIMGQAGAFLWREYVTAMPWEEVLRQVSFTIDAASIRRPNRDRDVANYQQVLPLFLPGVQTHAEATGDYEQWNFLLKKWAEYHDADLEGAMIPPQQPDPAMQQAQQQQMQLEAADTQADIQLKQAKAQQASAQTQIEAARLAAEQQPDPNDVLKPMLEAQQHRQQMSFDAAKGQQEVRQSDQKHQLAMQQLREKSAFEARRQEQQLKFDRQKAAQQARQKPRPAGKK